MQVDFAFICDYAEAGGKINAMGIGFDTIFAKQVPVTHSQFFLVAQFRGSVAEVGEKEVTMRLINADGADVIPELNVSVRLAQPPQGSTESTARLALRLNSVVFKKFSEYSIHLLVGGNEVVRIPMRVAEAPVDAGRQA